MPKVVARYKEQAKQKIIEAGSRVFSEKGYYQCTMDDIAEAMGVSKGAIYQYFKSKEELFIQVMEFMLESRKDEILSVVLSDDPMFISTGAFFESRISESLRARSFSLDLFFEAGRNESLRSRMTKVYESSYNEFMMHVEKLRKQGVIRKAADVGVVWRGVVALRDGLITSILFGANPSDAKKTWEYAVSILIRGIFTGNSSHETMNSLRNSKIQRKESRT